MGIFEAHKGPCHHCTQGLHLGTALVDWVMDSLATLAHMLKERDDFVVRAMERDSLATTIFESVGDRMLSIGKPMELARCHLAVCKGGKDQ
ncbi:hypothetical protein B296_00045540 [Ensete ventricosum]|uniref:Uncharacterized protein n=1 Tax=Ensete ventricosum TaxID=4639 RepID=A0A426YJ61_ENSVE|nr:hypothetical protein B296_00045540 [Ensete ventricosum]